MTDYKTAGRVGQPPAVPPPAIDVFVVVYDHRHGIDVSVYTTIELATAAVAGIAREWWSEITGYGEVPDTPDGLTDEEATEIYFAHQDDEGYAIEPRVIQRPA